MLRVADLPGGYGDSADAESRISAYPNQIPGLLLVTFEPIASEHPAELLPNLTIPYGPFI
jgi:hypothetical protein